MGKAQHGLCSAYMHSSHRLDIDNGCTNLRGQNVQKDDEQ